MGSWRCWVFQSSNARFFDDGVEICRWRGTLAFARVRYMAVGLSQSGDDRIVVDL